MSIENCFSRGGGAECTRDELCILQPSTQPGGGNICVPATSPPVLSEPADISDPEIKLLKIMISSLSNIDLGDRLDNELKEMYAPLVYHVNTKIRSEVAGASANIPWGTLADRLANMILRELEHTTCPICITELNDREDRSSVIYPSCCGGRQVLHQKCFREAVTNSGKCPSCRATITMEKLRVEERTAEHLERALLPFPSRAMQFSLAVFRDRKQRLVEQLNHMWERAQQMPNLSRTNEIQRRRLELYRIQRRDIAWGVDNGLDDDGRFAQTLERIDANIARLVYEILVSRRSLGMATVGPNGSIELKNGTVYLIFLVMGIVGGYLIHGAGTD
ncbi:unnamed protein product [Ectocarpus sp. 4 AP-2014]|uniref:EsV-1-20 n=1 Tax=Ectocarpus siliculosus virus 1 (isolate New Zealand/Kaikoura/1988) TaxID=654926 RepID=Q8QNP1_ESV1K|nr:EsV-1-20 [Ectocarpus siliculosus virus 1]AAK14446.1 EsV-1-20 [Ectocarpus siliculosus virus 1]